LFILDGHYNESFGETRDGRYRNEDERYLERRSLVLDVNLVTRFPSSLSSFALRLDVVAGVCILPRKYGSQSSAEVVLGAEELGFAKLRREKYSRDRSTRIR